MFRKMVLFVWKRLRESKRLKAFLHNKSDSGESLKPLRIWRTDSGEEFQIYSNYRDMTIPGWRDALTPGLLNKNPSLEDLRFKISAAEPIVEKCVELLGNYNFDPADTNILEIGCNDGAKLTSFLKYAPRKLTGSDISFFYQNERRANEELSANEKVTRELAKVRSAVLELQSSKPDEAQVIFLEDDISNSNLGSGQFDLVFAWNVFEHLQKPKQALENIFRVLKPGGIFYNKYCPFFSERGGHSLCTLDFPWGHTRLSGENVERYFRENRPEEAGKDIPFYNFSLNRVTITECEEVATAAGFIVLNQFPWVDIECIYRMPAEVLRQTKQHYPKVSLVDLISPGVISLFEKPK